MGVDPKTGKPRPIQLDYDKLKRLQGEGKLREAGYIVPEMLQKPIAIFEGLTQDVDEPRRGTGWLCYSGRPTQCFEDDGRKVPVPRNRVFLVFVTSEWIAYNWYWYEADACEPGLPDGHAGRFHKRLL